MTRSLRSRIVVLLLAVALLPQAGCAQLLALLRGSFQRPTMTFKRLDITQISFSGIGFNIVMDAQNTNAFALDLGSIDYQLDIESKKLAEGHANQPVRVPARGVGEVTLPIQFQFVELGQALMSLFTAKDQLPFHVHATLGFNSPVGKIPIPVDHNGMLPVPKLPDVKIASANMGSTSLSGTTLNINLGLTNKNAFALPLGKMNYRLNVAGTEVVASSTPAPNLGPNGSANLTIPVQVNFLSLGGSIAKAIKSRQVAVGLTGGLDIPGLGQSMPINQSTTLNLQ